MHTVYFLAQFNAPRQPGPSRSSPFLPKSFPSPAASLQGHLLKTRLPSAHPYDINSQQSSKVESRFFGTLVQLPPGLGYMEVGESCSKIPYSLEFPLKKLRPFYVQPWSGGNGSVVCHRRVRSRAQTFRTYRKAWQIRQPPVIPALWEAEMGTSRVSWLAKLVASRALDSVRDPTSINK